MAESGIFSISITSDCVGYATQAHPCSGQFLRGGEFVTIGAADGIDIQAIIPQTPADADWELESRGCSIQEISDTGVYTGMTTGQYLYLTAEDSAAKSGAGWYTYNSGTYEYAVRIFTRGQGFILNGAYFENADGDELGSSIMSAGEVKMEAKTIEHPCSGQFLRCNYRPVKLDIQKIIPNTPEDADWDLESRGCSIQEISDTGVYTGMTTGQYLYLTAEDSAAKSGAGWYTYNNGAYEWAVREFEPGQGFILNGAYFENADGDELGSSITIKD